MDMEATNGHGYLSARKLKVNQAISEFEENFTSVWAYEKKKEADNRKSEENRNGQHYSRRSI